MRGRRGHSRYGPGVREWRRSTPRQFFGGSVAFPHVQSVCSPCRQSSKGLPPSCRRRLFAKERAQLLGRPQPVFTPLPHGEREICAHRRLASADFLRTNGSTLKELHPMQRPYLPRSAGQFQAQQGCRKTERRYVVAEARTSLCPLHRGQPAHAGRPEFFPDDNGDGKSDIPLLNASTGMLREYQIRCMGLPSPGRCGDVGDGGLGRGGVSDCQHCYSGYCCRIIRRKQRPPAPAFPRQETGQRV
jgi:hypothetical protein